METATFLYTTWIPTFVYCSTSFLNLLMNANITRMSKIFFLQTAERLMVTQSLRNIISSLLCFFYITNDKYVVVVVTSDNFIHNKLLTVTLHTLLVFQLLI